MSLHKIFDGGVGGVCWTVRVIHEADRIMLITASDREGAVPSEAVKRQFAAIADDALQHGKAVWLWLPETGSWMIQNQDCSSLALERNGDDPPTISITPAFEQ